MTVKIHNEPGDDLLSTNVKPAKLIATDRLPQRPFGGRHVSPKLLRELDLRAVHSLADNDTVALPHAII